MAKRAISDHFDGKRFFNPGADTDKGFRDFLKWSLAGKRAKWPQRVVDPPQPSPPADVDPDVLAITFIGQATFLLQFAGCNLLTDPVFSERASPFASAGPKRVRPPGVAFDDLPRINAVLLSHNHYDHMDLASLKRLQARFAPVIVTGLENGRYLAGKGIGNAVELDWWETHALPAGLRVTYVPAQHWSSRTPFDRRAMLWGGHVVEAPAARLYFAGDSGYSPSFAEIRRRLGAPDVALLPIGAYEPRWFMAAQHMDPADAVWAHLDLGASLSLAMHFGTFQLTDEAIDAPGRELAAALAAHGLAEQTFRLPGFGDTLTWRRGG